MIDDASTEEYEWGKLVPAFIHPLKVEIIEAMFFMETRLSASDLRELFCGEVSLSNIHYHMSILKDADLIVKIGERQVRGATEKFFVLR